MDIRSTVFNSDWISYPMNTRLGLMRIIQVANIPIYYTGASVMYCTMETFIKVT